MKHDFLFMQSSMLTGCSYDDETRELTVTFSNSKNYVYEDVDKSIYDELIGAESAGKYFNSVKAMLKVKK
jgi:hypothetical protein